MALTEKKLAFCLEYMVDFDRTAAIRRIGYTKSQPGNVAYKWMLDPEVIDKINELRRLRESELNLSSYDVLKELKTIVTSDIGDFIDEDNNIISLKSLPPEKRRAVASISKTKRFNMFGEEETTVKLQFWDKNSAIEKLGKHFGVFEADNRQKQPLIQVRIE